MTLIITQTDNVTSVSEDGLTDSYTIKLNSQPTDVVTVTITSSDSNQLTTNVATLTFDANNWNDEQTVTLSAIHDSVAEGNNQFSIINTATSADTKYNNLSTSVTASVGDNDTVGLVITQTDNVTYVSEDGLTDSYTIKLNSQPTDVVTVTITSSDSNQLTTNVATLTFDANNWNDEQTVTLSAIHDSVAEGYSQLSVTNTATSADTKYNNLSTSVAADVGDNDTVGLIITQTDNITYVSEDGLTDSYTIKLNSQPTDVVTVTITSSDSNQLTTNVATFTFDANNWNDEQTVTLSAINDSLVEGNNQFSIINTATSADTKYNNLSTSVAAGVGDNDVA
ncbi:hypothetical protein H6G32_19770, partial [Cylindrospermum sp. FACHB-282]|nr:hypothetical protein [Cylindrospermum sp. FACHB-282]